MTAWLALVGWSLALGFGAAWWWSERRRRRLQALLTA